MRPEDAHRLAREKGANPVLCFVARIVLTPFFLLFFRLRRTGSNHVPGDGPVLIAANHRSFSDPFFIGVCIRRRLRFVAKVELFDNRWKARLLIALGAFPIRRGESDEDALETARAILESGGAVVIFPEGTRVRPGPLGAPRSGLGRLALETGAPIVPAAIHGTDDVRSGWRIRPRKVTVRFGRALTFPRPVDGSATSALAREVTSRAWSCVQLGWESLGGIAPIRTVAVIGAGSFGTAVAVLAAKGGASVQLGCRTAAQAELLARERRNERYLPTVPIPEGVTPLSLSAVDLETADLVCLAVPASSLPPLEAFVRERLGPEAAVALVSKGLVPPGGELPSDWAAAIVPGRSVACLGGPAHAVDVAAGRAGLVVASTDRVLAGRVQRLLAQGGRAPQVTDDVAGVQLAGCAKNVATLAAGAALAGGATEAGVAAGAVWRECHALARARGAREATLAGAAGVGDLVATVLAPASRNRRAGELLRAGVAGASIESVIGQSAEGVELAPLLAAAMHGAGVHAPATEELARLVAALGQSKTTADVAERRSARAL